MKFCPIFLLAFRIWARTHNHDAMIRNHIAGTWDAKLLRLKQQSVGSGDHSFNGSQLNWTSFRNSEMDRKKIFSYLKGRCAPQLKIWKKTVAPAGSLTKMASTSVMLNRRNARYEPDRKFLRCIDASSQICGMRCEFAVVWEL